MASFSFDTAAVAPRENNFELIPAGAYVAQVTESSIVDLKTGNGQALKLTFELLTEGYRGRKIWVNLNIKHTNPTAEQISQQQLRELCEAVGLSRMVDTAELHNKPVEVKVKIRVSKDPQYSDQNEIVGYKAASGAPAPSFNAPRVSAAPAANAPAAGSPPWQKKAAA